MKGIISYGAYIPFNRLQRSTIAEALQSRAGKGERSVASYDEDTITMAVEAARNCMASTSENGVSSLFFATTDPPYQEKLNAATAHAALGLAPDVRSLDLGGSIRAGLTTLMVALDSGLTGGHSLAMLSDVRIGAPEGGAEQSGGDGAVAFLCGTDNLIAEVVETYSETLEHQAVWRLPGERFTKVWEERFSLSQIYGPLLASAIKGILTQAGVEPASLAAVVLDAPNPRATLGAAKSMALDAGKYVDGLLESVGHTGVSHAGIMLASALDNAKPGDLILAVSVSDGVDAILLKATDAIASFKPATSVKRLVDSKRNDLSYNRYLKWRDIIPTERPRRPDPARPAGPPVFRRRTWKFSFIGSECTECGTRHLPPQKVCVDCGATEKMKDIGFANRLGKVATFTLDRLAFTPQPPMVAAVLDFDGGGRMELEITDCEPDKVAIGDEVEMTFRRFFTADGIHNYFWKSRPKR